MIGLSVLFANDDVLTQWVMTDVLKGAGFTVTSACRGSEVVDLLTEAADFDILLADLDLTDMAHGFDIGHHWRRTRPGRPVIYTGASRDALVHPLQFNEAFLQSPFSASALLRAVDAALDEASFRPMVPVLASRIHHVH